MKKIIFFLSSIVVLITLSTGEVYPRADSARFKNVKRWHGEFHYQLDRSDGVYQSDISFMKLKGLSGETLEKIIMDGTVTFEPVGYDGLFAGRGKVKYDVSTMFVGKMGEAVMVDSTDGKGTEIIEQIEQINYLRFDDYSGTYSLAITPGIEDEDMNAFGVYVESISEMKLTRAFINKMEDYNRDIPFPEYLKNMFPDVIKTPDRISIAAEAFGIPLPASGTNLKGSYKDENGGVFTWNLKAVR